MAAWGKWLSYEEDQGVHKESVTWNFVKISASVFFLVYITWHYIECPLRYVYQRISLGWFQMPWSHDDVIKWKHFPRYWPFVRGIHRSPVNSPHKGQWLGALIFSVICVWINGWVNNREAGDLRRCRAHYDVTVMPKKHPGHQQQLCETNSRVTIIQIRRLLRLSFAIIFIKCQRVLLAFNAEVVTPHRFKCWLLVNI